MIDVTDALQHVDLGSRDEVYHTCRALLVDQHDHLAIFYRAFEMFGRAHSGSSTAVKGDGRPGDPNRRQPSTEWPLPGGTDTGEDGPSMPALIQTWSDVGVLAEKDFGEFSPDEII